MSKTNNSRWMLAAMAAPVTQAASNCSWVVALCVGALCLGIAAGMERLGISAVRNRLLSGIQWLWMLLIVSEFLHWIMLYWPSYRSYHVVPLSILTLAAYSSAKGRAKTARAAAVALWLAVFTLGPVLLSGTKEIRLEYLKPQWKIQTAYYIVVMLIPAMGLGLKETKGKRQILAYAVLASAIVSGVLSMELIERMDAPFYELSRSVSLMGVGRRFESLVAAGMTVGYFVLMTYLLHISAAAWERGRVGRSVWISAAFSGLVFLSGMRMNSRLLAAGSVVVWVLIPILEKTLKILKLPIDKS